MAQHTLIFDPRPEAKKRLFCFPYAGGSSAIYRTWASLLPPDWELVAVDYPGRMHMKEAAVHDMDSLLELVLPHISALLDRPFVFFGHSFGSVVAYAVTRQLQAQGSPLPSHLFVSSRSAPQQPSGQPQVRDLDDQELVQVVEERYQAIPEILKNEPELLKTMLPILRADLIINGTYQVDIDAKLSVPITMLHATHDKVLTPEGVDAWKEVTNAGINFIEFDGGHFFIDTKRDEVIKVITDSTFPE